MRVRAVNTEVDEKELASFKPRSEPPPTELQTESGAVALETNQSNVLAEPKDESNNLGFAVATAFLFGLVVMGVVYREDLFALMSSFTESLTRLDRWATLSSWRVTSSCGIPSGASVPSHDVGGCAVRNAPRHVARYDVGDDRGCGRS